MDRFKQKKKFIKTCLMEGYPMHESDLNLDQVHSQ